MQYMRSLAHLLANEAGHLARVTKISKKLVPKVQAQHLEAIGSGAFTCLRSLATATMLRAWVRSDVADEALAIVRAPDDSDKALAVNPIANWERDSMVVTMAEQYARHHRLADAALAHAAPQRAM